MATVGYLRVSTADQDNGKFRHEILEFANNKGLGKVKFVEEKVSGTVEWRKRELATILDKLKKNDSLIVPELSRLGRSTLGILEVLKVAKEKGVNVYAVKGNWQLDDSIQSKVMVLMFSMLSEIERDLISIRTKEALAARKAKGLPMGRPKGTGKSKLDEHKDEIKAFLETGSTYKWIAKKYSMSDAGFYKWMNKPENKDLLKIRKG